MDSGCFSRSNFHEDIAFFVIERNVPRVVVRSAPELCKGGGTPPCCMRTVVVSDILLRALLPMIFLHTRGNSTWRSLANLLLGLTAGAYIM